MSTGSKILLYGSLAIIAIYFFFSGLKEAQGFMSPLITAVVLALLVLPLARKLEGSLTNRGVSSFLNTFLLFLISLGFFALLSFQVKSFVDDWPLIKETMTPKIEEFKGFVFEHTPLTKEDLDSSGQAGEIPFIGTPSESGQQAYSFFTAFTGFFGNYLLTFIYIFFLLNYRSRFREFFLRLFPDGQQKKVREVIGKSADVVQDYLLGKLILMGLLAVVYSVGLGISGVSNFILVSIIAAIFTLIPYIGNIIGLSLAMIFGYLTSGELSVLVGVIITFTVAQFIESYVLQPYIVGDKVNLHPFFVIVSVIIGNALWGIIGMILAIPIMAIITIIFLHIPPLHPFGYLFSKDNSPN